MSELALGEATELKQKVIDIMADANAQVQGFEAQETRDFEIAEAMKIGELLTGRNLFVEAVGPGLNPTLSLNVFNEIIPHPSERSFFEGKYIGGEYHTAKIRLGSLIMKRNEKTTNYRINRFYQIPIIGTASERLELTIR